MGNYLDLKQRVIAEMARDDLEEDLTAALDWHLADACAAYGARRFWFNLGAASVTLAAGAARAAIPPSLRSVDRVTGPGGALRAVRAQDLAGDPATYAVLGGEIALAAPLTAAATLNLDGLLNIPAPAADTDANAWTREAASLIAAHAAMTLAQRVFRDPAMAVAYAAGAAQALADLERETQMRLYAPLRPAVSVV